MPQSAALCGCNVLRRRLTIFMFLIFFDQLSYSASGPIITFFFFKQQWMRVLGSAMMVAGGLVMKWLGRRTCDKQVASSTPCRALLR